MSNQAIIDNLEALLAEVKLQPESTFDLSVFKKETECGTIFCAVGLACTMPRFQEMGFEFRACEGVYRTNYFTEINGEDVMDAGVADPYFGGNAFRELFSPAGDGRLDGDLNYYEEDDETGEPTMTDKELIIARLEYKIAQYKKG